MKTRNFLSESELVIANQDICFRQAVTDLFQACRKYR